MMGLREREEQNRMLDEASENSSPGEETVSFFSHNRKEEDRKGTWGDRGYSATDSEAHRDVVYSIPSYSKQTLIVFMTQMKQFGKMKWTYFMLFVALLIPILSISANNVIEPMMVAFEFETTYSNAYIAGLLAFLPILLGLFTSVLCGKQIPQEFKERTAYMNISMPIDRSSFYIGKYLAGFLLSIGIFLFAYGSAIATSMMRYDSIFADLLSQSLILTIVGVFAYSATAFCVGSFMKKGSSIVPFIFMSIILPTILGVTFSLMNPNITGDLTGTWIFQLPCFIGEGALAILGASMSPSVGMLSIQFVDVTSIVPMVAIGIVWGLAFLAIGLYRTMRREM